MKKEENYKIELCFCKECAKENETWNSMLGKLTSEKEDKDGKFEILEKWKRGKKLESLERKCIAILRRLSDRIFA